MAYVEILELLPRTYEIRYRVGFYVVKVCQLCRAFRPNAILRIDKGPYCVVLWGSGKEWRSKESERTCVLPNTFQEYLRVGW